MSDVLSMPKETASEKLEKFIEKNRGLILGILIGLAVAAGAVCAFIGISDSIVKKGISVIDSAEFEFINKSSGISDSEKNARMDSLMNSLNPYLAKKNIVGVRANMLAAEVAALRGNYSDAVEYSLAAAAAGKKFYTSAVSYVNAGSYSEELGKNEDAVKYYMMAADSADFLLASHALFSAARVTESSGDYAGAAALYKKVLESSSSDVWADLSQSRLIKLRLDGKIDG